MIESAGTNLLLAAIAATPTRPDRDAIIGLIGKLVRYFTRLERSSFTDVGGGSPWVRSSRSMHSLLALAIGQLVASDRFERHLNRVGDLLIFELLDSRLIALWAILSSVI